MQKAYTISRQRRPRYWTPERLDEIREKSRKPMTVKAECATAAVTGAVTFALFVLAAAIGA